MTIFISGFLLGFSLILAIGAQNAFVLKQGLREEHVLPVVLVCALSDAALIASGVAGFGVLVEAAPWIDPVMRYGGAAFLIFYAWRSLKSALKAGEGLDPSSKEVAKLWPVLATCLALTWLNPHVYLDTVVLLGSISAGYGDQAWTFGWGAMTASLVFFSSLGFGAVLLRPLFGNPISWRILDGVVAVTMAAIAISLILH